ncbi:hypothetical protein UlMin_045697 [Ulmus minor]
MPSSGRPPPAPLQFLPEGILIPGLPNDIALDILARIPRWHHPVLSAVSKPIRSLLASPAFFDSRSLSNSTQTQIYLVVKRISSSNPFTESFSLFAIYPKPNQNPRNHLLVPVPPPPVPLARFSYVVLGTKIYVFGGNFVTDRSTTPRSGVLVFDCRFHTWELGPTMLTARRFAEAFVVNGKIYLLGGLIGKSFVSCSQWVEVFDPVTGNWELVSGPDELGKTDTFCVVIGNLICVFHNQREIGIVFDTRTKKWKRMPKKLKALTSMFKCGKPCMLDGILYYFCSVDGKMEGFDKMLGVFKEVKGLEKVDLKGVHFPSMVNVGGRLVVVQKPHGHVEDPDIWCGEIEVKDTGNGDLSGEVRRLDKVARSFPEPFSIVDCLSVTL